MRLIWFITVLAWLVAGLAPLHAAGMGMTDGAHATACCPETGATSGHDQGHDSAGQAQLPCKHAAVCAALMIPPQLLGPASDLVPARLHWHDSARTARSVPQVADPPPPRL